MDNTAKNRQVKNHALDALLYDLHIATCPTAEGKELLRRALVMMLKSMFASYQRALKTHDESKKSGEGTDDLVQLSERWARLHAFAGSCLRRKVQKESVNNGGSQLNAEEDGDMS